MDVLEAIYTRRSVRRFTGEPVSDQDLEAVLKAGFHAPSAHNLQPWDFIVIKNKEKFEQIAKAHTYAKMLPKAEICILLCGDTNKQQMTGFLIEDCSAAMENMLLAAHGIGLGAVWCGLYPVTELTDAMRQICFIPDHIIPVGMMVLGHKGEEKKAAERYDTTKLHYEEW
ncbi:MAG: nitroreductase [Herbinix sp.]|jgi:nitroreductase|nr:nitroreductase [Herbinix sp.]